MLSLLFLCGLGMAASVGLTADQEPAARLMRTDQEVGKVNVVLNHAGTGEQAWPSDGTSTKEKPQPPHKHREVIPLHMKLVNEAWRTRKNQGHNPIPAKVTWTYPGAKHALPSSVLPKLGEKKASLMEKVKDMVGWVSHDHPDVDEEMLKKPSPLQEAFTRRFGTSADASEDEDSPTSGNNGLLGNEDSDASSGDSSSDAAPDSPPQAELSPLGQALQGLGSTGSEASAAPVAPAPSPVVSAADNAINGHVEHTELEADPVVPSPSPHPSPTPLAQ